MPSKLTNNSLVGYLIAEAVETVVLNGATIFTVLPEHTDYENRQVGFEYAINGNVQRFTINYKQERN